VIEVLSNELDRGLGTVSLFFGLVEVVDEYYAFLPNGRPVVAFPTFLHLGIDGVLGLIGTGLC
jgi:hypothetical protein